MLSQALFVIVFTNNCVDPKTKAIIRSLVNPTIVDLKSKRNGSIEIAQLAEAAYNNLRQQ